MYQAWPWGGTAAANPTAGYVQPTASSQVPAQWPAGYGQYAVTPEMQQQWAAAWASQAQYAYSTVSTVSVPTIDTQPASAIAGAYPGFQAAATTTVDTNALEVKTDAAATAEKPKTAADQSAQDMSEAEKMKQLKEQAEKWTSLQQPASSWSYSTAATDSSTTNTDVTVSAPNVSTDALSATNATQSGAAQPSQLTKEEEEFERQFKDWEKQFEAWKQQNQNHPDKEAFAQYEKQWQEWRDQLLQKKDLMQKAKAEQAAGTAGTASTTATAASMITNSSSSNISTATTPGMYYQPTQYMYMQPYMYPGGVAPTGGVVPPVGVPPSVVPPVGMPPPMMTPTGVSPQMPYGTPNSYGNQMTPGMSGQDLMQSQNSMNYDNHRGQGYDDMYNYGPGHRNGPRDGPMGQNYEGYDMNMREGDYQREQWHYGRGGVGPRGRGGRGRTRGRGGYDRWSEGPDMDKGYGQRKTLLPGGPPPPPGGAFDKEDSPPPYEYPTEDCRDQFGPGGVNDEQDPNKLGDSYYNDGNFGPYDENFPDRKRFPPDDRFMNDPEGYDDGFPPGGFPDHEGYPSGRYHPNDDRYLARGRYPSRHMMEEGRYGNRDFDQFPPPDEEMFGPPPFRDDFPPFDDRGPRGRGRYSNRGRGRYARDFDRFGPPFPPRMGNEPFGPPDFPPDDRFGFPGDGPRGPRGMRPYGPSDRYGPDDRPYFDERPSRFKTIDYTHRHRDEFDSHYDYEGDFKDDVNDFRDNFNSGAYVAPNCEPIIFSQVSLESFDYGHGMKPLTTTTLPAKEALKENVRLSPPKDFSHPYRRDRSPPYLHDRSTYSNRFSGFPEEPFPDDHKFRDRDFRLRESDRNDRERSEKDRDIDRDRRDSMRERDRDNYDRDRDNYDRDRGRDRDLRRDRDWGREQKRDDDDKRFKWNKNQETDHDFLKDKNRGSYGKKEIDTKATDSSAQFKPPSGIFKNDSTETVLIEDILVEPKRSMRPKQLVIILRGLPGSGKTYFAKLIKDKEIENGGSAPRILSLDDYFMVETEVTETDPDTGKRVKKKEFKFEYELEMEEAYRSSLFKSFKKTIDDRFFPFIIVDAVHEKSKQYEQYWSYAKQKGFQVYIAEMDCSDPVICHKRNIHNRSLEDITKILKNWESKPRHFISVDVRSLLQDMSITEVEMEVEGGDKSAEGNGEASQDDDSQDGTLFPGHEPSRWEKLEATEEKLDQLDGLRIATKKKHSSMEDYLQLPDDYDDRKCEPGKKRVRWADLEQRKEQDRMRAIGFVVGQTDWIKMTDPTQADKALTKTKYF